MKLFANKRMDAMNYFALKMSAVAVLATAMVGPALALPMVKISVPTAAQPEPLTENVHLICDRYGRCYKEPDSQI